QLEFTATKEKQFAGNYPDAITLRITYLDPNLGEVTYADNIDIIIPESLFADGSSSESFAADYMVVSGTSNPILSIFHYGGLESNRLPTLAPSRSGAIPGTLDRL